MVIGAEFYGSLIKPVDLVIVDAVEDVSEIGLWFSNAVTRRQSNPAKSASNCAGSSQKAPSRMVGHSNAFCSNRLWALTKPVPSHQIILSRSARFARNAYTPPSRASFANGAAPARQTIVPVAEVHRFGRHKDPHPLLRVDHNAATISAMRAARVSASKRIVTSPCDTSSVPISVSG